MNEKLEKVNKLLEWERSLTNYSPILFKD
jgi:hypothetical protein